MKKFEVIRLPLMTTGGEWVPVEPEQWDTTLDKQNMLSLRSKNVGHFLNFGNLLAIEIGSEEQVTNVGKTLGRMALTGVGAALFSKGGRGGVGAGLIDLSVRGAEKKTIVSGLMIFVDSTVVKFRLTAQDFENIESSVPEWVFSADAIQNTSEMFGLLRRMKADGERVLHELLAALVDAKAQMHHLLTTSEGGQSFAERDAARQELAMAEHNFQRERFLFTALLYDMGLSPQQFFAKSEYSSDVAELVSSANINRQTSSQSQSSPGQQHEFQSPSQNEGSVQFKSSAAKWVFILLVVVVFGCLLLAAASHS